MGGWEFDRLSHGMCSRHEARHMPRLRLAPLCSHARFRVAVAELGVVRRMSAFAPETLRKWKQAAHELGFTLIAPYQLRDSTGADITYAALLPEFGSEHGMLVIVDRDYAAAMRLAQQHHFGFSILDDDPTYDRDSFVDMLCDWGWTGSQPQPVWYVEPSTTNDECA